MSRLTIIRGLPGSGKSTLAKAVSFNRQTLWLEGDQYFEVASCGGAQTAYFYDSDLIREAHKRCRRLTQHALEGGFELVVSNTFTRLREMQWYLDIAEDFSYVVEVIKCTGDYGSIHNVPEKVLDSMAERWEDYPEEINIGRVTTA